MNIQIEAPSHGLTHCSRVYEYDDMIGCMVRGFRLRVLRVFVRLVWRTK